MLNPSTFLSFFQRTVCCQLCTQTDLEKCISQKACLELLFEEDDMPLACVNRHEKVHLPNLLKTITVSTILWHNSTGFQWRWLEDELPMLGCQTSWTHCCNLKLTGPSYYFMVQGAKLFIQIQLNWEKAV